MVFLPFSFRKVAVMRADVPGRVSKNVVPVAYVSGVMKDGRLSAISPAVMTAALSTPSTSVTSMRRSSLPLKVPTKGDRSMLVPRAPIPHDVVSTSGVCAGWRTESRRLPSARGV